MRRCRRSNDSSGVCSKFRFLTGGVRLRSVGFPGLQRPLFARSTIHTMAGSGTIALVILEDLEDPDAIVIPWGGGRLTCGIAAAFRALRDEGELRSACRIFAAEVETAAPLAASFR